MRRDPLRIVEAAYAPLADAQAWIDAVARAASAFDVGGGYYAFLERFEADSFQVVASSSQCPEPRFPRFVRGLPLAVARALLRPSPRVLHTSSDLPQTVSLRDLEQEWGSAPPAVDALIGGDERDVLVLGFAAREHTTRLRPADRRLLSMVIAHLGAAARLRNAAADASEVETDAWLTPSGQVIDARGAAQAAHHRASLALAVERAERARGALRHTEPGEALGLWRALVHAEWSLVDTVESDGKRVILARRNHPATPQRPRLTTMERTIAFYAAAGHSHKAMAYALGLSTSTIALHLRSALVKLGVRTRAQLARLYGHDGSGSVAPGHSR
jgi:DNA-binding CsgD family transcriptional regulator